MADAIQSAFQDLGIFQLNNSKPPVDPSKPISVDPSHLINQEAAQALAEAMQKNKGGPEPEDMSELRKELENQLSAEIGRREVSLRLNRDGLVVSLREIGFFDSGSAELKETSRAAFSRIVTVLQERSNAIRIEGHTDSIPIHTTHFASNWELSTARATEVVRLLIVTYRFPSERLSAAGYAEYHPIASNSNFEGRQMNRRVDLVILYSGRVPAIERADVEELPAPHLEAVSQPSPNASH